MPALRIGGYLDFLDDIAGRPGADPVPGLVHASCRQGASMDHRRRSGIDGRRGSFAPCPALGPMADTRDR
jgi:hypothetical protein